MNEPKFIYMVSADCDSFGIDGWVIKIGIAKNIKSRISNVQSGCPFDLWLCSSAKTYKAEAYERELHAHLKEHRLRGEWFHISDIEFDFVSKKLIEITKEFRGL